MKPAFLSFAFLCISTLAISQTKKIAHRSHSGNSTTFSIAGPDNFGLSPAEEEKRKNQEKLLADSIAKKAIADSLARKKKIQPAPANRKPKTKSKS